MKQRLTIWLTPAEIEQLHAQSQETNQTISVLISGLLASSQTRSEPDPVMVTLQGIQSQLAQLQQQVNGTFARPAPVQTVNKAAHMPTHPGAAALQKKAMTMCDDDDLLYADITAASTSSSRKEMY